MSNAPLPLRESRTYAALAAASGLTAGLAAGAAGGPLAGTAVACVTAGAGLAALRLLVTRR